LAGDARTWDDGRFGTLRLRDGGEDQEENR
jgi:hypothetical protein